MANVLKRFRVFGASGNLFALELLKRTKGESTPKYTIGIELDSGVISATKARQLARELNRMADDIDRRLKRVQVVSESSMGYQISLGDDEGTEVAITRSNDDCNTIGPGQWSCSRFNGHEGDHVACSFQPNGRPEFLLETWKPS